MERRKDKRFPKRMIAKINSKPCLIDNISRTGVKFFIPVIPEGSDIVISLKADEKTIKLKGFIRWSCEDAANQSLKEIGVYVENGSREYCEFVKNLEVKKH